MLVRMLPCYSRLHTFPLWYEHAQAQSHAAGRVDIKEQALYA